MKKVDDSSDFLLVTRGQLNLAIPLIFIHRVIEAQEVTPTKNQNESIVGVTNYHGMVIPVLSLDKKFSIPEKELSPEERFVLIRQNESTYAIITDNNTEVIEIKHKYLEQGESLFPEISGIHIIDFEGVKIIHIFNPNTFFTSKDMTDIKKTFSQHNEIDAN